jgi:serine/threonine protein kinase
MQGEKQFRTEVDVLSRVRHPHLLALIGYCADGGERALVYPLMQNHSLFDQLHRESAAFAFLVAPRLPLRQS